MKGPFHASTVRFIVGASLLVLALGASIFLLPGASQERQSKLNAVTEAKKVLDQQEAELAQLQKRADEITRSRACLEELLGHMSGESVGQLQWMLHKRLFEIAKENTVSIRAVKYGSPSREGAKGTDLESLDVEFTATGVYQNLKPFMLALEGSKMPFAVVNAKLEESPEGARLSITVRAFRRSGGGQTEPVGEGA